MPALAGGQGGAIHIWLESVDVVVEPHVFEMLDGVERGRADRFAFERDRRRFVGRRAFLRRVLGDYAGLPPADLRYRLSASGKPELVGVNDLTFSTSHADGLAIVAVAGHGQVGVDIERLRPMPGALDIARRFFTEREWAHLRALPQTARSDAFLRLWTRKEAYVKVMGRGLSMPLDGFEVLEPFVTPAVRLWPVEAADGFVATVAATDAAFPRVQRDALRLAS
jgi:4'-phosphopantetheinyl transferase